jgi:hypothetical protein
MAPRARIHSLATSAAPFTTATHAIGMAVEHQGSRHIAGRVSSNGVTNHLQ